VSGSRAADPPRGAATWAHGCRWRGGISCAQAAHRDAARQKPALPGDFTFLRCKRRPNYVKYGRYYVTDTAGDLRRLFNNSGERRQFLSKVLISELDETERQIAELRKGLDSLTPSKGAQRVPQAAEKLLSYLLSPDRLEEAIGDFEDGYKLMLNRHGIAHARRWYWWQVFKIAVTAVFDLVSKTVRVWAG